MQISFVYIREILGECLCSQSVAWEPLKTLSCVYFAWHLGKYCFGNFYIHKKRGHIRIERHVDRIYPQTAAVFQYTLIQHRPNTKIAIFIQALSTCLRITS